MVFHCLTLPFISLAFPLLAFPSLPPCLPLPSLAFPSHPFPLLPLPFLSPSFPEIENGTLKSSEISYLPCLRYIVSSHVIIDKCLRAKTQVNPDRLEISKKRTQDILYTQLINNIFINIFIFLIILYINHIR